MEQILGEIRLHFTDARMNEAISAARTEEEIAAGAQSDGSGANYTRHYNQGEDFFLKLDRPFRVPQLPIHHDVRNPRPEESYLESLRSLFQVISAAVPSVFHDLTYIFDPSEVLRPSFYHLYRVGEQTYLYLLRVDLAFRPQIHTVVEKGSNDTTPEYETDQLFIEADLIPLDQVMVEGGKVRAFKIQQSVSQTWIGETGRGYFVQGIWIDRELTKFLSKLFLPSGMRSYPYYPFTCKYRAICLSVIDLESENRKARLPVLHRAIDFVRPFMGMIQDELKQSEFSENLKSFKELQQKVQPEWKAPFEHLRVKPYLNENGMKEFRIDYESE
ncbi:hypothetical protein [Salinispira pacifica]